MGWNTKLLLLCQFLILPVVIGIELEEPVPERFLPPRHFNPHPITDVVRSKVDSNHLTIPAPSDIYAHYQQHRAPAYKDQEYRQYASVDQQLAYAANVDAYIADAHHHQEFDTSAPPYSSPTAGYEHGAARSYQHEQFSGTSESPVHHFTQVTHHNHGAAYTSKSVQHRSDHYSQKPYSFAYSVLDDLSGDDFSHQQANNGHATQGEYRVKLPDGRTQVVRYTADNGGYRADVSYEPEAPAPYHHQEHHQHHHHQEHHQQHQEHHHPQQHHLLQPEAPLTHATPSPFYPVVKSAFYGGQAAAVIPGHEKATDIQPAQLAFEQHLVYKRMSHRNKKSRRVHKY